MYLKDEKFIDFIGENMETDGFMLCAINALKSSFLNLNRDETFGYDDSNSTYFRNNREDLAVDLILCSFQSMLFITLIFALIILGLIGNSRQRNKAQELKKKQPVVVNRDMDKTLETKNKKTCDSKSVDVYENVSKTETVNNTDLASNFDETKSVEKKK